MSEKWVLAPTWKLEGGAMNYSVPPIPDDVWSEMVERGATALAGDEWAGPNDRPRFREEASRCLRAALGLERKGEG